MKAYRECVEMRTALSEEFRELKPLFAALGDENRQQIFLALLESEEVGLRVGQLTERTHLSRPAVSHHIRILKEAGILRVRRQGAMPFYSFDVSAAPIRQLCRLFAHITAFMAQLPGGEDDSDREDE